MKKIILQTIIFLLLFQYCKAQKRNYIDSIQNEKQIINLIAKIDKDYKEFEFKDSLKIKSRRYSRQYYRKIADSLNLQPWKKADFDGNGLTDILVFGQLDDDRCVICILDKGEKFEINRITRHSFQNFVFAIVENNKIKYYTENNAKPKNWNNPPRLQQTILTYKFGDFIEENKTPIIRKIEKIEYDTGGCFGSCPVFFLTINADSTAKWSENRYDKITKTNVAGDFKTKITKLKLEELIDLLNYIDFENLKDEYAVSWTDDQAATLKITYDNGKIKTIYDYGLLGTFGLQKAHELLFALRENQNWAK